MIKWPEEDTHSIVPKDKISTPVEEIAAGSMYKVKGFEKCLPQTLAVGTHEEMVERRETRRMGRMSRYQNLEDGPFTKKKSQNWEQISTKEPD